MVLDWCVKSVNGDLETKVRNSKMMSYYLELLNSESGFQGKQVRGLQVEKIMSHGDLIDSRCALNLVHLIGP